ncbi:hypothetical protein CEB3_c45030 [Peptococcaceae bacterium CEB3]|nr:hypothetical protein CEB3_c45030 [Peptococcaceae bacterium CEB3]
MNGKISTAKQGLGSEWKDFGLDGKRAKEGVGK